jgi:hypothetical protein
MSTEISTVQPRGLALDTFEDAFRFSASWLRPATLHRRTFAESRKAACWPSSTVRNLACRQCSRCRASQSSTAGRASTATRPWLSAKARRSASGSAKPSRAKASTWLPSARRSVAVTLSRWRAGLAWRKPRRLDFWGKQGGPWTQYPRRMLQMRARGFALRDAFPDVLRGLVTAEEAADYTHVEPEPVRVTQPTPPKPPVADDAAMAKARSAIDLAKDAEQVRKFAGIVRQRVDDGFYAEDQAAELFEMLDERMSVMDEVPA